MTNATTQQHAEQVTLTGLASFGLIAITAAAVAPALLPIGAGLLTSAALLRVCGLGR